MARCDNLVSGKQWYLSKALSKVNLGQSRSVEDNSRFVLNCQNQSFSTGLTEEKQKLTQDFAVQHESAALHSSTAHIWLIDKILCT